MRQNPHVRICGGPGSATTLVYPTSSRLNANAEISGGTVRSPRLLVRQAEHDQPLISSGLSRGGS